MENKSYKETNKEGFDLSKSIKYNPIKTESVKFSNKNDLNNSHKNNKQNSNNDNEKISISDKQHLDALQSKQDQTHLLKDTLQENSRIQNDKNSKNKNDNNYEINPDLNEQEAYSKSKSKISDLQINIETSKIVDHDGIYIFNKNEESNIISYKNNNENSKMVNINEIQSNLTSNDKKEKLNTRSDNQKDNKNIINNEISIEKIDIDYNLEKTINSDDTLKNTENKFSEDIVINKKLSENNNNKTILQSKTNDSKKNLLNDKDGCLISLNKKKVSLVEKNKNQVTIKNDNNKEISEKNIENQTNKLDKNIYQSSVKTKTTRKNSIFDFIPTGKINKNFQKILTNSSFPDDINILKNFIGLKSKLNETNCNNNTDDFIQVYNSIIKTTLSGYFYLCDFLYENTDNQIVIFEILKSLINLISNIKINNELKEILIRFYQEFLTKFKIKKPQELSIIITFFIKINFDPVICFIKKIVLECILLNIDQKLLEENLDSILEITEMIISANEYNTESILSFLKFLKQIYLMISINKNYFNLLEKVKKFTVKVAEKHSKYMEEEIINKFRKILFKIDFLQKKENEDEENENYRIGLLNNIKLQKY